MPINKLCLGKGAAMKHWTFEEDGIIKEYYPKEGMAVLKRLPGRTRAQLLGHVYYLGLYYADHKPREVRMEHKSWTEAELDILREHFPIEGLAVSGRLPGRTKNAISMKACELKIGKPRNHFTEEEDEIIRKYYPEEGTKVAERLPRHTKRSIEGEARKLGVSFSEQAEQKWSDADCEILKEKYPEKGGKGMVELFGGRFTVREINRKANRLGLKRRR